MMPSSVSSFILIIGHYQMLEQFRTMAPITLLKRLVYVYGNPYIEFARSLLLDRPRTRFLRNLVSQLECSLYQEWYPTRHFSDPLQPLVQKLIIDIIEDLLQVNEFLRSIQGLNLVPDHCIRKYNHFFEIWTTTVYTIGKSSWDDVAIFVFGTICIFEAFAQQRDKQYNACSRALRTMNHAGINLVPVHILLNFGIQNGIDSPGTEHLREVSSQVGSSDSESDSEIESHVTD
jgi:hypothetical protein